MYVEEKVLINEAIIFATRAHGDQVRKGTETPYILHPLEAGIIASKMTEDPEVIAAAILHDVMEDADVTHLELAKVFSERVADLVDGESEDKSKTWKERKSATLDKLGSLEDRAELILVLADKLSNIRAIHRDHRAIGDEVWERFNVKDKSQQGWYYKGIVQGLSSLKGTDAYDEFVRLVGEVFGE